MQNYINISQRLNLCRGRYNNFIKNYLFSDLCSLKRRAFRSNLFHYRNKLLHIRQLFSILFNKTCYRVLILKSYIFEHVIITFVNESLWFHKVINNNTRSTLVEKLLKHDRCLLLLFVSGKTHACNILF